MPEPPGGELALRELAAQFVGADGRVLAWLAEAATRDRAESLRRALELLAALRRLDYRRPVEHAYLAEHPDGIPEAVRDLAGTLALRLDRGAQTAADGARDAFRRVTRDNLEQLAASPPTANVDSRGARWSLGRWAEMNCATYGRHATSRGLADRVGPGHTVTILVGACKWCRGHAGEAVIGEDPLPPFHPGCTCVATT